MNQGQPPPQQVPQTSTGYGEPALTRQVFRPYATYALIGLCVVVFVLQLLTSRSPNFDVTNSPVTIALLKDNSLILQGQVWRLFTPMFLHGSIPHLLINMFSLFYIGPSIERFYRRWRYLALFLISGFAGNVLSFIFTAAPSLGASTSIFGLLAAEGVLIYQNRDVFVKPSQALTQIVIVAVINLVYSLGSPGIDFWGHVGGLMGGALFAWFGGPLLRKQGMYPPYSIADTRGSREVILAGAAVCGLFFFLTVVVLFMRGG